MSESSHNINEKQIGLHNALIIQEKQVKVPPAAAAKTRLDCLDIYRGLTMVGMILVDNVGDFNHVIWVLDESTWNGLTTADCVFPSFLFISGLAVTLAIKPENLKTSAQKKELVKRILIRSAKLFALGLVLNVAVSNFSSHFRIMGVLQRIALCYLVTSLQYIFLQRILHQVILNAFFMLLYIYFMYYYNVPGQGCGAGVVTPTCNFGQFFDQQILTLNHMIKPTDPEGIFTTLGAFVTAFIGVGFGKILQEFKEQKKRLSLVWLFASCSLILLGGVAAMISEVNKKVWTPGFVLIVGGGSGIFLNLCFVVVDIWGNIKVKKSVEWLKWLGLNPLFIFVAMIWLEIALLANIRFYYDSSKINLWNFLTTYALETWMNDYIASVLVALVHLALWVAVAYYFAKNKIFIKL